MASNFYLHYQPVWADITLMAKFKDRATFFRNGFIAQFFLSTIFNIEIIMRKQKFHLTFVFEQHSLKVISRYMTPQIIHAAHALRVKHQKILLSFIGKYFWNRIPLSVGDQNYQNWWKNPFIVNLSQYWITFAVLLLIFIYIYHSYSFTIPSDKGLKKCSKQPENFQSFYDENMTLGDIIKAYNKTSGLPFYYFISINLIEWMFFYDRYACKYYFPKLKLIP